MKKIFYISIVCVLLLLGIVYTYHNKSVVLETIVVDTEKQNELDSVLDFKADPDYNLAENYMDEGNYIQAQNLYDLMYKKQSSLEKKAYLKLLSAQAAYKDGRKEEGVLVLKEVSLSDDYPDYIKALAVLAIVNYYTKDSSIEPFIYNNTDSAYDSLRGSNRAQNLEALINFGYSLYQLPALALTKALNAIVAFEKEVKSSTSTLPSEIIFLSTHALSLFDNYVALKREGSIIGYDQLSFLDIERAKLNIKLNRHGAISTDVVQDLELAIAYARSLNRSDQVIYGQLIKSFYVMYDLEKNKENEFIIEQALDEIATIVNTTDDQSIRFYFIELLNFESKESREDLFKMSPKLKKAYDSFNY